MIEIKQLQFAYKKKRTLFSSLSLDLPSGRIYGLLGKNGAGKSTLLKVMSGLLYPHGGKSLVNGICVSERRTSTLKDIFLIPEEFELPSLSMDAFVEINAPFYPNFSREQYLTYLKEFEMEKSEKLQTLSFGQKKKFFIAFALAANTRIVLMDEPTNGLDIPSKSQFRKIIASAFDEDRLMLISTHQVRDLSQIIDHIIVLENGEVLFSHPVENISQSLSFAHIKDNTNPDVIYAEQVLGGYSAVCKKTIVETEIDIEMLFNAVIADHSKINNAIKNS